MTDKKIEKYMEIAKKEIGTKESPKNSNNVKYNTEYYGREVSGIDYAWCVVFIWWVFKQAGLSEYFYGGKKCNSCTKLRDFYKDKIVKDNYSYGDLIFFNFKTKKLDPITSPCYHVGFFSSSTSTTITTIDGNTGVTDESNGGEVLKRVRSKDNIVCGVRLFGELNPIKYQNVTLPIIKEGLSVPAVKSAQMLLNGWGYDCGKVDGIFGPKTLAATQKFQSDNGLFVDGEIGKDTYKKFFKE